MNIKIESIRLKNFKAFKEVTIRDIPKMCVVVGANGAGKSTLFDVFGFLRDSLTNNVQIALSKGGGFREVRTRDEEGAIEIELKFRFQMTTKGTKKTPLATYVLAINENEGQIIIEREELRYRRGRSGQPWKFLAFYNGEGELLPMNSMM
ncbi:MAG: AAA family ATPase [Nitrospiria bacterium]